jgi:hypothetical protein
MAPSLTLECFPDRDLEGIHRLTQDPRLILILNVLHVVQSTFERFGCFPHSLSQLGHCCLRMVCVCVRARSMIIDKKKKKAKKEQTLVSS